MSDPLVSNRPVRWIAMALMAVSLVLLCLLIPIHAAAFNMDFYVTQWDRLDVPEDTGMSMDELSRSVRVLWDYFHGRVDTPQVTVESFGESRPLYQEHELSHLADVQNLFNAGFILEQVLAAEVVGIGFYMSRARSWRALSSSLEIAGGAALAILAALALSARAGFTAFWTRFHLVAFANDMWLLDPSTDWLIKMFPEPFFEAIVMRIGTIAAAAAACLLASGLLVRYFTADHRH